MKDMPLIDGFTDFAELLFPRICLSCGKKLQKYEVTVCTGCIYAIPRTNFHEEPQNPVERMFWGRVSIEKATAFFYYHKGSIFQRMLHLMKYSGHKEIGYRLGQLKGAEIKESGFMEDIDVIAGVPLHPKKLKKRGYNQSFYIALGIRDACGININSTSLIRQADTKTQTYKSRYERWKNVASTFALKTPEVFNGKHILIIDDIVTTGATLEACSQTIKNRCNADISIATLGMAS